MAYTKTNLNETTETVAVDMVAEDKELLEELPFDEATETVVEQNARGYSKTVWNENTPITADKLNKIETGIANGIDKTVQIMEIPITNSDGWQQFRWTRPGVNPVSWTRDAKQGKAIEIYNEGWGKPLLIVKDGGGLDVLKDLTVNGGSDFGHTDLFLKHDGKLRGLVRGMSGGGLQLHSYDGNGDWLNYMEMASGLITLGANTKVGGNLTADGNLTSGGNLAFSNLGVGGEGGVRANIYNKALQASTGNGQMLTTESKRIYVGNPDTNLSLESSTTPNVKVGNTVYQLYHTGNRPTAGDVGALPLSGGTLSGNISVPGESKFYNDAYVDPWHGQLCSIKASGHVGIGGSLKVNGKLAFSNIGAGGGLNANIHNLALHNHTGNGQMLTADINRIYVGNPQTHLSIESSSNPIVNVGGNQYHIYHTGNKPTAWDIGAMTANNPSFEGNMVQHGPNGRNWIYHINADRGTLHIAPHNNGNPDWSKQIMFDRNGFMYCNVGRKVPTWDGDNPTHHMFRYGSGLGGANGYITFSY